MYTLSMDVQIRPYEAEDVHALEQLMVELQKYLVQIDPLQRLRLQPGYGQAYVQDLLDKTKREEGTILLAEGDGVILGCSACVVERQSALDFLGEKPLVDGRILELVVDPTMRGQGIGTALMQATEEYLLAKGCSAIRVGVMSCNEGAMHLYERFGYAGRMVDMLKIF